MANAEPTCSVDDILITSELYNRCPRSHDPERERAALLQVSAHIGSDPRALLAQLVDVALSLCDAGSSGLSVIRTDGGQPKFHWDAMAGVYAPYVGGTTPLDFSPCGTTLKRNSPQLFYYPGRVFTYFNAVSPPIVEGLVLPVRVEGQPLGTLWIVSHDDSRRFDSEDVRVMDSLCYFTAAVMRSFRAAS